MVHPILVVDDDATQLAGLTRFMSDQFGYRVMGVTSGREALEYFLLKRSPQPELVIINHSMMELTGADLVRVIRRTQRRVGILVLALPNDGQVTAQMLASGADDVLIKPVHGELLKQSIWNVLHRNMLVREVERLSRYKQARVSFADVESLSEAMRMPLVRAKQASQSRIPVLISGASGAGKSYLAQAIHGSGEGAGRSIIEINCALFDRVESSEKQLVHACDEAKGGTLLLTHIDAASKPMQQVMLAQLKAHKYQAYTGSACDQVRIISTASPALKQQYETGRFNEELYFLLTAFPIALPPLTERREDVLRLCSRLLSRLSMEYRDRLVRLSPSAQQMVMEYAWPGNIRELQMVLAKALIYGVGEVIESADLALVLTQQAHQHYEYVAIPDEWENLASQHPKQVHPFSLTNHDGNIRTIHELEAEVIRHAIRYYKGHMSEVARRLGIGRSTLYRKIQDYKLEEVA